MNPETKICQNCKNQFVIEPADFDFYKKIAVPPPTLCPDCRILRRFMWRNERSLYKRQCGLCQKSIVSNYAPEAPFPVYCIPCWYSDGWEGMDHGLEYDPNVSFFEQWRRLSAKIPRPQLMHIGNVVDSDYANFTGTSKNAYLSYSIIFSEDISFSSAIDYSRNLYDCLFTKKTENSYYLIDCAGCFTSAYLFRSSECLSSQYLFDCINCQDCFMSSNLRNKRYVFRNQQLSKADYEKAMGEVEWGSYQARQTLLNEFRELVKNGLHKYANILKSVNVSGDNIDNSRNIHYAFNVYNSDNVSYTWRGINLTDSYDINGAVNGELLYEGLVPGLQCADMKFFFCTNDSSATEYTEWSAGCTNVFGCIGLKKKQYCILNKQCSKEEYEKIRAQIIKDMNDKPEVDANGRVWRYGEFYPYASCPFAYNETYAQEVKPLTKEEATKLGFRWRDINKKEYQITLTPAQVPDNIKDVDDGILQQTIGCEHSGDCAEQCTVAFKITPSELQWYRTTKLPIPHLCPNCRNFERVRFRNPLKLWHRQCMCDYTVRQNGGKHAHHPEGRCPNEFETSYAPDRSETVYCESCYQSEVV